MDAALAEANRAAEAAHRARTHPAHGAAAGALAAVPTWACPKCHYVGKTSVPDCERCGEVNPCVHRPVAQTAGKHTVRSVYWGWVAWGAQRFGWWLLTAVRVPRVRAARRWNACNARCGVWFSHASTYILIAPSTGTGNKGSHPPTRSPPPGHAAAGFLQSHRGKPD